MEFVATVGTKTGFSEVACEVDLLMQVAILMKDREFLRGP